MVFVAFLCLTEHILSPWFILGNFIRRRKYSTYSQSHMYSTVCWHDLKSWSILILQHLARKKQRTCWYICCPYIPVSNITKKKIILFFLFVSKNQWVVTQCFAFVPYWIVLPLALGSFPVPGSAVLTNSNVRANCMVALSRMDSGWWFWESVSGNW